MPNVSSVYDGFGNFWQAIVHSHTVGAVTTHGLTLSGPTGTRLLAADGIRVVHLFRDVNGGLGLDIVRDDGKAFETDLTGTHQIGGNMVLDLSRTYDALGQFKLEILRATTGTAPFGPDIKGTLTEYTNTGHHVVSTTARWASTFLDVNRRVGLAFGFINATGNLVVLKSDSTGSRKLYNAPDGETQNLTDYSQTIDPQGHTVADITFGRFAGTYALHFTSTGVSMIGDGTNIRVGG